MPAAISCAAGSGDAAAWALAHVSGQPRETARRQRSEERVRVAEMVRRRGMADPGALGRAAQREASMAALGQLRLGGLQQRVAQVAAVVRGAPAIPLRDARDRLMLRSLRRKDGG